MSSPAVQEAVSLLRSRRDQARREALALTREAEEITGALRSLGADDGAPVVAPAEDTETRPAGKAVRPAVLELLESVPRSMTIDEIVGMLNGSVRAGRSNAQFRSTIRTALWTLKNDGLIVATHERGAHIASKWVPQDTEGPARDAGPSVPDPADQEGGSARGTDSVRVHDEGSSWPASHRVHDLGAPVVGA